MLKMITLKRESELNIGWRDWTREASFKSKDMMLKTQEKSKHVSTCLIKARLPEPDLRGGVGQPMSLFRSVRFQNFQWLSWAYQRDGMDLSITLTLQGGGGGGGGQGGDHQHQHGFSSLQRERGRERGGEQRRGGGERGEVARRRGEGEEQWWGEGETVWRQVEVFARGHRPQQSDHCIINHTEGLHINYRSFGAVTWKCRKYEKIQSDSVQKHHVQRNCRQKKKPIDLTKYENTKMHQFFSLLTIRQIYIVVVKINKIKDWLQFSTFVRWLRRYLGRTEWIMYI